MVVRKKRAMTKRKQLKKVAYFSVNSFVGGAEMATLNYCRAHLENGEWEPTLIIIGHGDLEEQAKQSSINTIIIDKELRMRNPLKLFSVLIELRKVLVQNDISFIHSAMGYAQLLISLAGFRKDIKKVWYQHGPVGTVFDRIASLFSVDYVFYNSAHLKRIGELVPASFEHSSSIVSPIVKSYPVEKSFESSIFNFAHLGRITSFKNIELILKGFKAIESYPVKLNLYGDANSKADIEYKEFLLGEIARLGLDGKVEFHGYKSDIASVLESNQCVIHSSRFYEPFGLTIAEVLLSATPLICSSQSGASEEFINNSECIKYDSISPLNAQRNIVNAMLKVIQMDKKDLSLMADNAQRRAQDIFNEHKVIMKLEGLYDKINN